MLEYRRASLTHALHDKGYQRLQIRRFRVFGQVAWQVDLFDRAGTVIGVLGGPAVRFTTVLAQIGALPPTAASDGAGSPR
ncbi:MAG TPA: hypothetical protein VFU72_08635 [Nitrolancea sp.]|nr:hypothetical protein [Nitrolancea sp.]